MRAISTFGLAGSSPKSRHSPPATRLSAPGHEFAPEFAFFFAALYCVLALLPGLSPAFADQGPVRIVATTGMVADLAREVGGGAAEVIALMGPGVDPHLYRASHGDLAAIEKAELVLYNGLHLEGKLGDVLARFAKRIPCVAVGEAVPKERLRAPPEFEGNYDPHIWFEVSLWLYALDATTEALTRARPAHAADFNARSRAYRDRLLALEQWIRQEIARIPHHQRMLITAHDAFGYFGRAYGLEVRGLQGISTATEYGLHDISAMVKLIIERKVPAIFVETSVSQRYVSAIQEGARAQGYEVRLGGELFSDAMGAAGTPEGHYEGMVRHNVATIVRALTGTAASG